jgi:predicted ATPase/DNA-binding CsgD family transcriptional regulator
LGEIVLDTAAHRQANAILITGEAGVGKTRLARETALRAKEQGFLILRAECFESDQSVPYAPLLELSETWLRAAKDPAPVLTPLASILIKWLPSLAAVFPNVSPAASLDPEQERHRLFHTFTDFLIRLTETQPLFILVEDLHWCDEISLHYWLYLIRHAVSYPIMLVLTYRNEQIPTALHHFLSEIDRRRLAREFPLDRLTHPEVGQMIRDILGKSGVVQNSLTESIYPLSEGNPLMVEEMLKVLISSGDLFFSQGQWLLKPLTDVQIPRTIQDAVDRRVAVLSNPARRALTLAAVMGRRFDFAFLQELLALDEQAMLSVMKELMGTQLVIEELTDRYAFRHALTRKAIYSRVLGHERAALHLVIAEAIERKISADQTDSLDTRVGDLADHFYAARVWDKALLYSQRAGEMAQALYAPRETIEYLTRALEAAAQMSLPLPIEILRARGKAYETAGEFEEARGDYEQALRAAQAAHDGAAEWQGLIDLGFLWASRDYTRTGEYFRRALELAREFGEPSTLAHSLNRLGNWHVNVEQPLEALHFHREALAIFQKLEDRRGLAQTLDLSGMANYLGGDLIQGTACYEQAIALFRELDDRQGLVSSLATMTMRGGTYQTDTMVPAASLVESAREGETALKVAREIGWRSAEAYAQLTLGFCLGAQGEYVRALNFAQTSLAIAEEIEHRQWIAATHCMLGALYLDLLILPMACQHLEPALALAQEIGSGHWIRHAVSFLASTYILQHEFARAESLLDTAFGYETAAQTPGQRLCWCARVELALARRDPNVALKIIEQLLASSSNLSKERVIPRLWKLRGEALAMLGKTHEAERDLLAAREAAVAQGARPLLWRIHVALGKLYRTQARRDEAEREISAAGDMIQTLAAIVPDEDLRRNFTERAMAMLPRPRASSPRRAEKKKFGGLTAREREVAALIAQGKSNREIAEILVVSERTVESHVTNILARLGFTSRTQIAAWAVDAGLGKQI